MNEDFQPGFGARLREGREATGLAVAEVAAKLKLTSRQVEALEVEDLSHLPSPVFVRGFVRNYARLVGVDPDSLIAPVDLQASAAETITAPSAGVSISGGGLRRWVILPAIALLVFLVLVAILYQWLRQGEEAGVSQEMPPPAAAAPAPAPAAESQSVPLPASAQVVPDGVPPAPADTPMAPATTPGQTVQSMPVQPAPGQTSPAAAPAPAVKPPPAPAAPQAASVPPVPLPAVKPPVAPAPQGKSPAAAAPVAAAPQLPAALPSPQAATAPVAEKPAARGHALRFEPAQDAWIQVVDGKGNRFSKLIHAGGSESFAGEPPFKLVVGEAAKVRMTYDGHVIDLTPFIGQKVARLTLE
ncbi:MAG TPA: DUF4115 domain-containing protein [Thiobacillaceae bacterium]|nr:DUF4115 domain-containing protein [Thiobacillaceae bacterium]